MYIDSALSGVKSTLLSFSNLSTSSYAIWLNGNWNLFSWSVNKPKGLWLPANWSIFNDVLGNMRNGLNAGAFCSNALRESIAGLSKFIAISLLAYSIALSVIAPVSSNISSYKPLESDLSSFSVTGCPNALSWSYALPLASMLPINDLVNPSNADIALALNLSTGCSPKSFIASIWCNIAVGPSSPSVDLASAKALKASIVSSFLRAISSLIM